MTLLAKIQKQIEEDGDRFRIYDLDEHELYDEEIDRSRWASHRFAVVRDPITLESVGIEYEEGLTEFQEDHPANARAFLVEAYEVIETRYREIK